MALTPRIFPSPLLFTSTVEDHPTGMGDKGQAPPPMLLNFGRRTMGIGMGSGREHHRTHTTPHISRSTTMIAPLVMVPPVRIRGSDGEDPGNLCRQMTLPAARCGERHCIRAPLDLHTLYF